MPEPAQEKIDKASKQPIGNTPDVAYWQLLILYRNGKPFKAFVDPAEANLFFSDYKQDDAASVYTLEAITSDHLHFDPPVGTLMTSSAGTKYVSVYADSSGKIIRDGSTFFIKV
jgi:hypothetical protein